MKAEKNEPTEILDINKNAPPPRPIPPIECKCGCGHTFQPRRKDQVYLNKQHADFGYNHNQRKFKHWKRKKVEKILRKNDRILEKHFKAERHEKCVTRYFDVVKADAFNSAYFTGKKEIDDKNYYYSYNYYYYIYVSNNIELIQIYKR
jgi:hypothetical protein